MLIELFGGNRNMELLIAADSLFYKTPDGKYWCKTIYNYNFWLRYLTVFESLNIVSRTKHVKYKEVEGYLEVNGPNIRISELPYMRGMKQYGKNYLSFSQKAKKAIENAECAIFRLPSVSADMVLKYYKKTGKPYALEVVADPFDAYASNKIAQVFYSKRLRMETLKANGVSYVTKFNLQSRYPSCANLNGETKNNFESYYSTINLMDSYFTAAKSYDSEKKQFTIVHTANSINNDIKGHEVVIRVLKQLRENGFDVQVIFIGDGTKKKHYEQLAKELDIEDFVTFTGLLSSPNEVRKILISGDIFVFPTKAEGLPRAIIEAMAVGLPVLSTPVNGIPELLENENMLDPQDVNGYVKRLIYLFENYRDMEKMSKINIEKAKDYTIDKLTLRRNEFYSKLRNLAES
jgi:glycosyltransferase involved in cell wall biosynthesis